MWRFYSELVPLGETEEHHGNPGRRCDIHHVQPRRRCDILGHSFTQTSARCPWWGGGPLLHRSTLTSVRAKPTMLGARKRRQHALAGFHSPREREWRLRFDLRELP